MVARRAVRGRFEHPSPSMCRGDRAIFVDSLVLGAPAIRRLAHQLSPAVRVVIIDSPTQMTRGWIRAATVVVLSTC